MSMHAIHHVTAVTANIRQNLDFYTKTLGLRLVKRSVNQDDVSAYHLFYADEVGSPGTDMTFFDWPTMGPHSPGAGTVGLTSFRVPDGSLDWWQQHLEEAGTDPLREEDLLGLDRILFVDPEGQRLELIEGAGLPVRSTPWTAYIQPEHAIQGIIGVDLDSANPEGTRAILTQLLDYREVDGADNVFQAYGEDAFARVRINTFSGRFGRVGAGGVHHVAFRVSDEAELNEFKQRLDSYQIGNSGIVERYYFTSLYFREPGGILFELATEGPGFAVDEDATTLGQRLALPPFLEPRRAEIEAGLQPLG